MIPLGDLGKIATSDIFTAAKTYLTMTGTSAAALVPNPDPESLGRFTAETIKAMIPGRRVRRVQLQRRVRRVAPQAMMGCGCTNGYGQTPTMQVTPVRPGGAIQPSGSAAGGALLALGGVLLLILILILALRFYAGWYVGKHFQRPVSGALVGGIFGAPGMGVLSLFPGKR
ncbi:MAG: hypothetical protein ACYTEQ_05140 [Planctomycetota bacterium]